MKITNRLNIARSFFGTFLWLSCYNSRSVLRITDSMLSLNIQLQYFSKLPPVVKPQYNSTKADGGKLRPVPAPSLYCARRSYCLVCMLCFFETNCSVLDLHDFSFLHCYIVHVLNLDGRSGSRCKAFKHLPFNTESIFWSSQDIFLLKKSM